MNKMIVLNQKGNLLYEDILIYIKEIKNSIRSDLDIIVCPSNIYIPYFNGKYDFILGSQDIGFDSINGEVTGSQLKSVGVKYTLVGHFERKKYLNETSVIVNKKIKEAINNNIKVIALVGETKEERNRRKTAETIIKQIKDYFFNIDFGSDIIIAYEPIWAIGTGKTPSSEDIKEVVVLIKNIIFKTYNINCRVLYGGSINEQNIKKLDEIEELDGFIIGGSSVSITTTLDILNLVK